MNKYLIEILKIQNSVILPGLGALMIPNQKSGTVVFNQHLKFNDGSFARFIAEKEGIDQQESQNKVAKFVREIEAELGKGVGYDMFEFGKFYKNEAGEVAFVMHGKEKPVAAKTGPIAEEKPADKAPIAAPVAILEANKKEEEDKAKAKAEKAAKKLKQEEERKATEEKAAENLNIEAEKKAEEERAKQEKLAQKLKLEAEQKAADELKSKEEEAAKKAAELKRLEEEKIQQEPVSAPIVETKPDEIVETIVPEETVSEPAEPAIEPIVEPVIIAESKPEVVEIVETIVPEESVSEPVEPAIKPIVEPVIIAESKPEAAETPPIPPTEKKAESDKIILDKQSKNTYTPAANVSATTSDKPNLVSETAANLAAERSAQANNSRNKPAAEEKKKRSKLPWLILLLLLIGLGVAGFFYKDQLMAYFDKGEDTTAADSTLVQNQDKTTDQATDEMDTTALADANADETISVEAIPEEVIEEPVEEVVNEKPVTVVQNSNTGSYHLIGNSFGEEVNATNYAQKMKDKGYPAKVLGRYDGLYLVSIKSFDTKEAAESGKSAVSQDAGSAWVFKQK